MGHQTRREKVQTFGVWIAFSSITLCQNQWRHHTVAAILRLSRHHCTLKFGPIFNCCIKETLRKFYRSLNSILRIEGRSDDMVMLRLLEAHCLPILAYGIEVVTVADRDDKRHMRVAYNAIYRKMFGYSYRESVTLLQHTLGRKTWEEYVEERKTSFTARLLKCPRHSTVYAFI